MVSDRSPDVGAIGRYGFVHGGYGGARQPRGQLARERVGGHAGKENAPAGAEADFYLVTDLRDILPKSRKCQFRLLATRSARQLPSLTR